MVQEKLTNFMGYRVDVNAGIYVRKFHGSFIPHFVYSFIVNTMKVSTRKMCRLY